MEKNYKSQLLNELKTLEEQRKAISEQLKEFQWPRYHDFPIPAYRDGIVGKAALFTADKILGELYGKEMHLYKQHQASHLRFEIMLRPKAKYLQPEEVTWNSFSFPLRTDRNGNLARKLEKQYEELTHDILWKDGDYNASFFEKIKGLADADKLVALNGVYFIQRPHDFYQIAKKAEIKNIDELIFWERGDIRYDSNKILEMIEKSFKNHPSCFANKALAYLSKRKELNGALENTWQRISELKSRKTLNDELEEVGLLEANHVMPDFVERFRKNQGSSVGRPAVNLEHKVGAYLYSSNNADWARNNPRSGMTYWQHTLVYKNGKFIDKKRTTRDGDRPGPTTYDFLLSPTYLTIEIDSVNDGKVALKLSNEKRTDKETFDFGGRE